MQTQSMPSQALDASFRQFLVQMEAATNRFLNGDATLWKELCSHQDDATIFGGWGGYERGWTELGPRYDWAAQRFVAGELTVEYIAIHVSGNLACSVALERSTVRLVDQTIAATMLLRVTHLFRYAADGWKLVHRHADPLLGVTPPSAVLHK